MATAVALLMIGGEFDLSVGSILALCGLVVADLLVAGHSAMIAVAGPMASKPLSRAMSIIFIVYCLSMLHPQLLMSP